MRIFLTLVLVTGVSIARPGALAQALVSLRIESLGSPTARLALERAATAAMERLDQPRCREVLSDFRDAFGRTIQERLDLLGQTPRSFLASLTFREGPDRRCQNPSILAFTTIDGHEIFVCSGQFWAVYRKNPTHIEALLIHEMMHTLGLGENPPNAGEITARVVERCW